MPKKISQMTAASTPDGSELVPIVQGGASRRTTMNAFFDTATLYVPAGTGAIDRTPQAKMREFVTPEDFYLAADADSGGMIQRALNTIGTTSCGVRFNPATTYSVSTTLTVTSKNNFQLWGAGRITQTATATPTLTLTSCTEFEIHGMYFYGYGSDFNAAAETSGRGIRLDSCSNFSVHHNTFKNHGSAAVNCVGGCASFSVSDNNIYGTHGITTSIVTDDNYQFGVYVQSGASLASPCTDFEVSRNKITKVAQGVRVEPGCTRYACHHNLIYDIKGQHGFYLNGTVFSIGGNVLRTIAKIGIKAQSYQGGAVNEAIVAATISGNTVHTCESGITVEKTSSAANNPSSVTIVGNTIAAAENDGYGIYAADVTGLTITGNTTQGGAHGIIATAVTAGRGCGGRISNNHCTDAYWAAINAYVYEFLSITDNIVVRPCLAAAAGDSKQNPFFISSSTTSYRTQFSGNVLLTSTSTGVVSGARIGVVDLWLGDNDLEALAVSTTGVTVRKRTPFADFVGSSALTGLGPILDGDSLEKTVTVTGAALGDPVVYASINQDLQGCTMDCAIDTADTLHVIFTNTTGGSVTVSNATLRYGIMRRAV